MCVFPVPVTPSPFPSDFNLPLFGNVGSQRLNKGESNVTVLRSLSKDLQIFFITETHVIRRSFFSSRIDITNKKTYNCGHRGWHSTNPNLVLFSSLTVFKSSRCPYPFPPPFTVKKDLHSHYFRHYVLCLRWCYTRSPRRNLCTEEGSSSCLCKDIQIIYI